MRAACMVITITLFLAIFAPISVANLISQDIVVDSYQVKVIRDANIKLTGNIIVKDYATLYISYSTIYFLGEPWEYGIILYPNSTLRIIHSKISSENEINFICTNSMVYMEDSELTLHGLMNGTSNIEMKNSTLEISNLQLSGNIYLNYSTLLTNGFFNGNITGNHCFIDGEITLNGNAKIYVGDVYNAHGGEWYIYRQLNLTVLDKYSNPVDVASVSVINFFDGNIYGSGITDKYGRANFILLSDYINNEKYFVGVYNISVTYEGKEFYKIISLPNYVNGGLSKTSMNYVMVIATISVPQNPENEDFVLSGNKTLTLSNGSFYYSGRMFFENGSSLILKNAELIVDSSLGSIILRDNAKIISENSEIHASIYLKDSIAIFNQSSVIGNMYSMENDVIKGSNTEYRGIYGNGWAELNFSSATNISLTSVNIFGGNFDKISAIYLNATACTIKQIYIRDEGHLYSVSYDNLSVENSAKVYVGYKLEVYVTNGHNREVNNATVSIYENNTLLTSGKTNIHGKIAFYLYSAKYINSSWSYNGNYRIVINYKNATEERNVFLHNDTYLHISFAEYLVPPLHLYIDTYTLPSKIEVNKEFILAGHAYYDNGEDAKNVLIKIKVGKVVINTTTSSNGTFSVKMPPMQYPGSYSITVEGNDTYYNLTATKTILINVIQPPPFPWYYVVIGAVVIIALVIVIRAIRIRRWKTYG